MNGKTFHLELDCYRHNEKAAAAAAVKLKNRWGK
jgi:hypothetical protein